MLKGKFSGFHVASLLFFVGFKQQLKKYSRTCFHPLSPVKVENYHHLYGNNFYIVIYVVKVEYVW